MRKQLLAVLVLLSCAGMQSQVQEKGPTWARKFEDFAVSEVFQGKPAPAVITKDWRPFRTRIREGARKGPNFAGHYTLVEWGCGSGCVGFVVVDAISGTVYGAPFGILSMPLPEGDQGNNYRGPVYQLKSRLLIADGCPGEKNCGTRYYEWKANRFKLLK